MRMSQYKAFGGQSAYIEPAATPARQDALLTFIATCIQETAVPPSVEEMRKHLGLASKSAVHRMLVALEARGKIRRMPDRARAIEVVGMPMVSPVYPQRVPLLDTSVGYQFFRVLPANEFQDAKLVEWKP